jgi:hypothetical protein
MMDEHFERIIGILVFLAFATVVVLLKIKKDKHRQLEKIESVARTKWWARRDHLKAVDSPEQHYQVHSRMLSPEAERTRVFGIADLDKRRIVLEALHSNEAAYLEYEKATLKRMELEWGRALNKWSITRAETVSTLALGAAFLILLLLEVDIKILVAAGFCGLATLIIHLREADRRHPSELAQIEAETQEQRQLVQRLHDQGPLFSEQEVETGAAVDRDRTAVAGFR